jgi:hypothetical protein
VKDSGRLREHEIPGSEKAPKFSYGYNVNDRPDNYVGKRRAKDAGDETYANIESTDPIVYLGMEYVEGLGDSVVAASMSFKTVVARLQEFSRSIEGEIYPERTYLPSAGDVRMRKEDGSSTPYRVVPHVLDC